MVRSCTVLGFGPDEIPTWNRKIQLFSQKWIFEGKFELRAKHAHKCFVRYRKYDVREFRNYEKKFVQVLPKERLERMALTYKKNIIYKKVF